MIRLLTLVCGFLSVAWTQTWRPSVLAKQWAVASGHSQASMAAVRVLEQGGNAIDAAVAATFATTVLEPMNVSIGGHGMVMIYLAKTGQVYCIDGSGWTGKRATADRFDQKTGGLPFYGPLAPVVPGLVDALFRASEQYGKLGRAALLAPSIALAEDGFVATPYLVSSLEYSEKILRRFPSTERQWFPNGKAPTVGALIRQPELARTMRLIAEGGRDAFYRGPIAKRVVEFLKQDGGLLEEDDFAEYSARSGPALHSSYRGYELYESPEWSFDHIGLETLNILEGYDLKKMGHLSADYIHYVTEAMKLAFADRDASVGDPRFPKLMPQLVSKTYAKQRRDLIRPEQAMSPTPVGTVGEGGHTDYVAVIDGERNMVSITSSASGGYGNNMYVDGPGGGFFLNNWMPLFRLDPKHANYLQPHKVPRTGWSPMLALKGGKPFAAFGTGGGDTIAQAQLQFFIHLVDFGMNAQQALEQPWFRTEAFEAYRYPNAVGENLMVSERIPEGIQTELKRRGHVVKTHKMLGVANMRAVVIDPVNGTLSAAASPGSDGYAMGK